MRILPDRPGDFNQGLMELGEVVCIPNGAPLCEQCPLQDLCLAHQAKEEEEYPVKSEKKARTIQQKTILVFQYKDQIGIARRPEQGLLAGLYEFPSLSKAFTMPKLKQYLDNESLHYSQITSMGPSKHIFSHIEWKMRGYHIWLENLENLASVAQDIEFVTIDELRKKYTIPVAFHHYLEMLN